MSHVPSGPTGQDVSPSIPAFPCMEFPSDTRHAKLLGIYPQRQAGLYMQRVRIPGGVLSGDQWRVLARIARQFTPATPMHLTTRQDIELHDLSTADVPAVQQLLAKAALTTMGSGGDTLRNVIVCPCAAGGTNTAPDMLPLAAAIDQAVAQCEGVFALPRKFKISLGCEQGCGRPFMHDLAFIATQRDGRWGLKVIGAGSLGAKPALGIVLMDWIEANQAVPMSVAAVRLFAREGDRQNRAKARLRHARQRLGDEAFLLALQHEFEAAKAQREWQAVELSVHRIAGLAKRVLTFANGDITSDAADALAAMADLPGFPVRIGNDHRVYVFADSDREADQALARTPSLCDAMHSQINVMACPGTRWCTRGLVDTNALADRIRKAMAGYSGDLTIAISGCPNGCVTSAIADIGLTGGRSSADGTPVEKFTLMSGGRNGASNVMAQQLATGLSADQAIAEVIRLVRA